MKNQALAAHAREVIVVTTWSVRTMAERGANRIGHTEDLMLFAKLRVKSDTIGLQQIRRNGWVTFCTPTAGYTIYCGRHSPGNEGKPKQRGVGLAVMEFIVRVAGPDGIVVEHVSVGLVKVCIALTANCVVTFVVGCSPTDTAAIQHQDHFWAALYATAAQVPTKKFLIIMIECERQD